MAKKPKFASAEQYLEKLAEIGWFERLPEKACRDVRKNVAEAFAAGERPEPWPEQGWFDAECVYEEGDHKELLKAWVECSYGVFRPNRVTEKWEPDPDGDAIALCTFGFTLNDTPYAARFPVDSDYVGDGFYELVDKAIGEQCGGLIIAQIPTGGQDAGLALCNAAAHKRAIKDKLVADPNKASSW